MVRQEKCLRYLVDAGVDANRIITASEGERRLLVQTERANAQNRRVEIQLVPTALGGSLGPTVPAPTPASPPDLRVRPEHFPSEESEVGPEISPDSEPAAPAPQPDRPRVSFSPGGLVWLDIVINPPGPTPPEARVGQAFRERGIPLSGDELRAIMEGRGQGIQQLERIIREVAPQLDRNTRSDLARKVADALLGRNAAAQAQREAPTASEEAEARQRRFEEIVRPQDRGINIEGGIRIRIHF